MTPFHPRSYLFVPGNRPERFSKGLASGADALILDLEDSVPAAEKATARTAVADWLQTEKPNRPIWIRINPLRSPVHQEDLNLLARVQQGETKPAGVLLPKCEGVADIRLIDKTLGAIEQSASLPVATWSIIAIITETARAMQLMHTFEQAMPRLAGMLWGAEDLAADLGLRSLRDANGRYLEPALRARDAALFASHASHVTAIDAVYTGINDDDGLKAETSAHAALGFTAKTAIHPRQIPIIHQALQPDQDDIAWAHEVIAELADGDRSSGRVRGAMVDLPHLQAARSLLRRSLRQ